jgi:hypothetical protein
MTDNQQHPDQQPFRTGSQKCEQSSQKLRSERLAESERIVRKMLSAYPDYGKAPPEYLLSMIELFVEYPSHIQMRLGNHRSGVPSLSPYLPTAKDVIDMGDEMLKSLSTATRYERLRSEAPLQIQGPPPAYVPFPKLCEAFSDEKGLLKAKRFDQLFDASRALATTGKEKAREILMEQLKSPGDA